MHMEKREKQEEHHKISKKSAMHIYKTKNNLAGETRYVIKETM